MTSPAPLCSARMTKRLCESDAALMTDWLRRYLLLEFPALADAARPQHVAEIGCGCGSSLLPVLKANPAARVTATDISPTAVRLFTDAAARAGIAPERYSAFPCNAADPDAGPRQLSGAATSSAFFFNFAFVGEYLLEQGTTRQLNLV